MELYKPTDQETDARRFLLIKLTAAALAGIASMNHERHGQPTPSAEEIGRRAVAMAKGAALALEEETETAPDDLDRAIAAGRIRADGEPTKPTKNKGR